MNQSNQTEVSIESVLAALGRRVSTLAVEVSMAEAQIEALNAQIESLKSENQLLHIRAAEHQDQSTPATNGSIPASATKV